MFDHVYAIDWSASSRPSPQKPSPDSIFIAQKDLENTIYHPKYFRTDFQHTNIYGELQKMLQLSAN